VFDGVIHKAAGDHNILDMDMQRQDYASFVFDEVGTFQYFCKPHPYMMGTITVIPR
jgi:plastocyanin